MAAAADGHYSCRCRAASNRRHGGAIIAFVEAAIRQPLAEDTPLEVEEVQLALWRTMTPQRKMQLISGICRAVLEAAREGVRRRHPDAGERDLFLRLAIVQLGETLAVETFPDAATLVGRRNEPGERPGPVGCRRRRRAGVPLAQE